MKLCYDRKSMTLTVGLYIVFVGLLHHQMLTYEKISFSTGRIVITKDDEQDCYPRHPQKGE